MKRLREPQGATTVARNGGAAAVAGGMPRMHAAPTTMAAAGGIEIICGPMFSGKTTALLARVASEEAAGRKVMLLKSALDDRYGASIVVSHDGKQRECLTVSSLSQLQDTEGAPSLCDAQVLAIDEAQFFADLVQFCTEAVEGRGQRVIVAGLDGDFRRRKFGQLLELVPLADSVTKLSSKCAECGAAAPFTLRTAAATATTLIGGSESYKPACRRCYQAFDQRAAAVPTTAEPRSAADSAPPTPQPV